ncbi:hypothetical protein Glove_26g321 [Diversispora epigaea]|uniref:Uncharacterized protein n=1 Tax=Diversispora epigaea TaxID=1348612 RepID=A0A397JKN4_9GLOM|nr:hypothetical protein Glove_26g321 [Diversispora epigaea]
MPLNTSDIFFISIFIVIIVVHELYNRGILTMEMLYAIAGENVTMYAILGIVLFIIRKNMYASPPPNPTPISTTLDADIKELKRDNLSIKNEITRMQNQSEWRSEVRSQGL